MKHSELVRELRIRTKLDKVVVDRVLDELIAVVRESLFSGNDVTLKDLGRFETRRVKASQRYNYFEDSMVAVPAHSTPVFRVSPTLRRAIKKQG